MPDDKTENPNKVVDQSSENRKVEVGSAAAARILSQQNRKVGVVGVFGGFPCRRQR